jgi:hypothetical protein
MRFSRQLPVHRVRKGILSAWSVVSYFLRYFSSTSTEQISPDSAGPFTCSIRLALLFLLLPLRDHLWRGPPLPVTTHRTDLSRFRGTFHSFDSCWLCYFRYSCRVAGISRPADISKQPGRSFDKAELDFELRSVWPHSNPVKGPPPLDSDHVARPDLTERFTTRWTGRAIEAVGISGSGKTMLAAEIAQSVRVTDEDRHVYYAEVRTGVDFRDVLVGLAYHLRRIGIDEPFALSVHGGLTGEQLLARLARSYSALQQPSLVLLDLVEGTCDAAFARDLATFVRALSSSACRIAIFGQESPLRELTSLERSQNGVSRLDIRGFSFEEFVKLVAAYHPNPDRAVLWTIYQRVTAGRAAGLFAGLARALAAAPSLEDMSTIAARPAEDVLALAEQQRFARVSPGARIGAEKLVCFALPFRRKDAEEIFPNDNIGVAILELLRLGLLRSQDEDLFEMHETVRAGLEGAISLNVRRAAHEALAAW